MMLTSHAGVPASPMRLLEMLTDRFGVFEALAHSTIENGGHAGDCSRLRYSRERQRVGCRRVWMHPMISISSGEAT